jgi:hypothetical protein
MSAITLLEREPMEVPPRISMIEQKLQSNVHPREFSTTSTCRPSIV